MEARLLLERHALLMPEDVHADLLRRLEAHADRNDFVMRHAQALVPFPKRGAGRRSYIRGSPAASPRKTCRFSQKCRNRGNQISNKIVNIERTKI